MGRILLFLLPQALSLLGSSIAQFGIVWALTDRYSSGTILLLSSLALFLPQIVLSLISGKLSDTKRRKATIILSDSLSAFAAVVLFFFFRGGRENLFVVVSLLAVRSAANGLQSPAVESALPAMVSRDNLERANGLKGLLSSVAMLLAPALAGFLLGFLPLSSLMILDGVTAIIAIAFLIPLDVPESGDSVDSPISVVRYIRTEKTLRKLFIFHFISLFLISPGAALTPLLVSRIYGGNPSMFSISEFAYSAGMVAGGAFISSFGLKHTKKALPFSLAIYGSMLALMGAVKAFPLYIIFNATIGIVSPLYTASIATSVQKSCRIDIMGRAMAILSILTSLAIPAGLLISAPLCDVIELRSVFILFGLLAVLHSLLFSRRWIC